jgi:SNF2 family DNA or RNA helicase
MSVILISNEKDRVRIKPARYLADEWTRYHDALRGAVYDAVHKSYVAPRHAWPTVARALYDAGFTLQHDLYSEAWIREEADRSRDLAGHAGLRLEQIAPMLEAAGKTLRAYQRRGVLWLAERRTGLLLDEQGTGKTIQALCSIPQSVGVIIFCPASLRGLWRDEIRAWRKDLTPTILVGRSVERWPRPGEAFIVIEGSLRAMRALTPVADNLFVISDECHLFRGRSKRTENMALFCMEVRRQGGWTIGLTGTPLMNRPSELFTVCKVFGCARLAFGSWSEYLRLWNAEKGRWGEVVWGEPSPDLHDRLMQVALRRTRAEVMPELPPKTYRTIPVEVRPVLARRLDDLAETSEQALSEWDLLDKLPPFVKHAEWRAALAEAKTESMIEWVKRQEEALEPCLVFSMHLGPLQSFEGRPHWAILTGETPPGRRTEIVDDFQAGRLAGVALSITAGGLGLTLTRAASVLFVDKSYTPAENAQAEDRVCRYGQKRAVMIDSLVADHPLDRRIDEILTRKALVIGQVVP